MSRPLFEIGEEVILHSPHRPEYNGDYIVLDVIYPLDRDTCRLTGQVTFNLSGVNCYKLNEIFDVGDSKGREAWVYESSLRKKHKPSEFGSYGALMNNLKIKEKV